MLPAAGGGAVATFAALGSQGWLGVAGLVLVCGFLPQLTTTIGVPWAGPDRAAIVGALELITALTIGWTVIGEPTRAGELLGTLLIGTALVLVGRKPVQND
jgi:drug/metabolite transporter (DMT)-like permease